MAGVTYFRMSLGERGKPPPARWCEAWPEVLGHVFFAARPVGIPKAQAGGGARLFYYLIGGDGPLVAVADVTGPPETGFAPPPRWTPSKAAHFKWRLPVDVRCRRPGDAEAPRWASFGLQKVGPGPFARIADDAAARRIERAICAGGKDRRCDGTGAA